ncbi:MAG: hypothetical protein ACJAYB_000011 [Psychromonas sp.]|jgi:hypothetical protein
MALIVETGAGVASAESFTTDAEFVAYAAKFGVTLPALESDRDILQRKAIKLILQYESRNSFKGLKVDPLNQNLPYPRKYVYIHCELLASNVIPHQLKTAQLEAGLIANTGQSLITDETVQDLKVGKLNNMEAEFHKGGAYSTKTFSSVRNALSDLFKSNSGFGHNERV